MCNNISVLRCHIFESGKCLILSWQPIQCCPVADDDWLPAAGSVTPSLPVQSLSDGPGWSHDLVPVLSDILMVWVMRAFQLLGAYVAEHDAEREEAEHANHQKDIHDSLRLSMDPSSSHEVHSLLRGVVLRYRWGQYTCTVEAVLQ